VSTQAPRIDRQFFAVCGCILSFLEACASLFVSLSLGYKKLVCGSTWICLVCAHHLAVLIKIVAVKNEDEKGLVFRLLLKRGRIKSMNYFQVRVPKHCRS